MGQYESSRAVCHAQLHASKRSGRASRPTSVWLCHDSASSKSRRSQSCQSKRFADRHVTPAPPATRARRKQQTPMADHRCMSTRRLLVGQGSSRLPRVSEGASPIVEAVQCGTVSGVQYRQCIAVQAVQYTQYSTCPVCTMYSYSLVRNSKTAVPRAHSLSFAQPFEIGSRDTANRGVAALPISRVA